MNSTKILKYLNPLTVFDTKRTRTIFKINPTVVPERVEATETKVTIFDYSPVSFQEVQLNQVTDSFPFKENNVDTRMLSKDSYKRTVNQNV